MALVDIRVVEFIGLLMEVSARKGSLAQGSPSMGIKINMIRPIMAAKLLVVSQEMVVGVLWHNLTVTLEERQMRDLLMWIRWSLREKVQLLLSFKEYPTSKNKNKNSL